MLVVFKYFVMFCPFFKDAEALMNSTIKFFLNQTNHTILKIFGYRSINYKQPFKIFNNFFGANGANISANLVFMLLSN